MILGSVEAGGTKFVCATSNENYEIIERIEFPTTSVEETIAQVIDFFTLYPVDAIGVGSFGPIDLNPDSLRYGFITNTPKPGWENTNFLGLLSSLNVPMTWTTDVNAAAYGEFINDDSIESCLYFTIGTGVGAGYVQKGELLNGIFHPEMGHMSVRKHPKDDFKGYCIFHDDCLEGLTAGPTLLARTGTEGQNLEKTDEVFDFIAYYIAQATYNTTLILSPERIVLGGGVMSGEWMLDKIKYEFSKLLKGYVTTPEIDKYITLPSLGNNSGTTGCLALAKKELQKSA